jgi:DNA-3-methyladenine glycosylase I
MTRCSWATTDLSIAYHDTEWGVPQHDDRTLFEMLTLEGAQAGLSWETILRKRDGYRALFAGFDPAVVATFDDARIAEIARDSRIVRHRGKIASTVANARVFLAVQHEFGSFAKYLWAFVDGEPIVARRASTADLPAKTPLAERVSADLKKRGFTFVGPTIVYAFLQATGVVNDHVVDCRSAVPAEAPPDA